MKNTTPQNKLSQRLAISIVTLSLAGLPAFAVGCENDLEPLEAESDNALVGDEIENRDQEETYRSGDNAFDTRRGDRLRGRHPRGMRGRHAPARMLMVAALTRLDLTDEQKTSIEKLLEDVSPRRGRDRLQVSERSEVHSAIAEGVRAGDLDPDAFEEHFFEVDNKIEQRRERRALALEQLHGILEPAQREQLVEAVRSRRYEPTRRGDHRRDFGKRGSRMHRRKMRGAGRRLDRAEFDRGDARRGDHRRGFGKRSPVGRGHRRLTRGLDLGDQQLSLIESLDRSDRPKRPGPREAIFRREKRSDAVEAMLDSFASDDFDATVFEPPRRMEKNPSARLRARIAYLAELSGILNPEQRELLAERLERGRSGRMHPAERSRRGGHGPGRQDRPFPRARH
ncbi:MAG: Spy/CpxP family protein refolding chaperone [Polyangia bacterium]